MPSVPPDMQRSHDPRDYVRFVELLRREKDHFLRDEPSSPIREEARSAFRGLAYFPVDPGYRVRVQLTKYARPEPIVLATSKGIPRHMVKYGFFEFEIAGVRQRLDAYAPTQAPGHDHGPASLFVPFRDATSGTDSYGAARYLDIPEDPSGDHVLDFNLAYNPYCAYSDDYVCPFPPRENWLTVPIRAGEKDVAH